jgi:hypothetical protein
MLLVDVILGRLFHQSVAYQFWAIICSNNAGLTAPRDYLIQSMDYALGWQGKAHFGPHGLSVKLIDHIKEVDTSTILKLVMRKVYGPYLVNAKWHA